MNWIKKGLIYAPSFDKKSWMYNSALTPTPVLLNENCIRVYFGARDIHGLSRIAYVDLNSKNPSEILQISDNPALDIGEAGCFDDNGVILGDVIKYSGVYRMYYIGFQLVKNVKFLAFTGIAESADGGNTFVKLTKTPILDRSDDGIYFRAIHSVIFENGLWKVWCGIGSKWTCIDNNPFPNYDIRYLESEDGIHFPQTSTTCIQQEGDEYRIGRPRVYKKSNCYEMYYTKGTINKEYLPGRATSNDGINWIRQDNSVGITTSDSGWDSETLCYPSLLTVHGKTYMFYNGNNMGRDGFGYAELVAE